MRFYASKNSTISCLTFAEKGFMESSYKQMPVLNHTGKSNSDTTRSSKNITMSFNISEIRQSVGDYNLLTSAELRMLIKHPAILSEQRVELYHGLGSSARYLGSRFITNQWKDKWLSFDVTEPLQDWLKGTGKIKNNASFIYIYLVPWWPLCIRLVQSMCILMQFSDATKRF